MTKLKNRRVERLTVTREEFDKAQEDPQYRAELIDAATTFIRQFQGAALLYVDVLHDFNRLAKLTKDEDGHIQVFDR